jgi:hypothetical protein
MIGWAYVGSSRSLHNQRGMFIKLGVDKPSRLVVAFVLG